MNRADELRPAPTASAVLRGQLLRLAGESPARLVGRLGLVVALFGMVAYFDAMPGAVGGPEGTRWGLVEGRTIGLYPGTLGVVMAYLWLLLAGLVLPLRVWREAGPAIRSWHRAMPIGRARHELVLVLSGAVALVALEIGVAAVVTTVSVVAGRAGVMVGIGASGWLTFFVGPLALYLVASVAAVLSERPGRWIFGGLLGLLAVRALAGVLAIPLVTAAAVTAVDGAFGSNAAMAGGLLDRCFVATSLPATGSIASVAWFVGAGLAVLLAVRRRV